METTRGRITLEWLRSQGACRDQVDIFRAEWGESAEMNPENLQKAIDLGLDLNWFAMHFLKRQEWLGYYRATEPLWADYRRATESLWADHGRAIKSLRADHDRAIESLWADHGRAIKSLRADHDRTIKSLWADYRRATGAVLGKALFGHDA